jgi:quercetin 2,3-dioxygenase
MLIFNTYKTREGGFEIRRAFPSQHLSHLDPFLMLDHMGPMQVAAGQKAGVSPHPHRGFETVTLMLEGELEHKDSEGNQDVIKPLEVQWMTAAHGIIHSEFPSLTFQKKGGILHGLQLWVNLPSKDKLNKPKYQALTAQQMPTKKFGNASQLQVIAGIYEDLEAKTEIHTPLCYYYIHLQNGDNFTHQLNKDWNSYLYVIAGDINVDGSEVKESQIVVLDPSDDLEVTIKSGEDAQFIFLSGQPINEPIASYGPFVMNTEQEIYQAIKDYQEGKLGKL